MSSWRSSPLSTPLYSKPAAFLHKGPFPPGYAVPVPWLKITQRHLSPIAWCQRSRNGPDSYIPAHAVPTTFPQKTFCLFPSSDTVTPYRRFKNTAPEKQPLMDGYDGNAFA
ncbi:hypothetical protein K504DRAFT_500855 [Pleomassaria siparia CBS 279.74]|uniref:Uncharacterized protein n=1 Tax=Pleomassaria siparia CBS 279.74 TaxID=1314801 RepID=A0A6G1KDL3_9PLEO|nr:hypothetical protein K504DRAFT_500855 [Pleomassaria siparia CBS 279.74]